MREKYSEIIRVGQRIYCGLYGGKDGTVVEINGEQNPGSCRALGGCGVTGGNANLTIVWDTGDTSIIGEGLARVSVQWAIFDEVLGSAQVAAARKLAVDTEVRQTQERAAQATKDELERVAHKANNPNLMDAPEGTAKHWSEPRRVAENIRRALKARFPGVKFGVRTPHYGSINIGWTDGPTTAQVREVSQRHIAGTFNGMIDSYEYCKNTFGDVFGTCQWISEDRTATVEAVREAWVATGHGAQASDVPDNIRNMCRSDVQDGYRIWKAYEETSFYKEPAASAAPTEGGGTVDGDTYTIEEHEHTKHRFTMYLVIPKNRLGTEEFARMRAEAEIMGGWYSRKWGSTPGGFAFKIRAVAQAFGEDKLSPAKV